MLVPRNFYCIGLNYREHIAEMGRELPSAPTVFAKMTGTVIGPYDDIHLPPESPCVDWEGELAVVIGSTVRRATEAQAAAAIEGFTICNDVTMRDWQRQGAQWHAGKNWEHSTPLGPVIVAPDAVGGVRPDLELVTTVDGQVVQHARTSDMVFDPVGLIRYISTFLTLHPGDVIATGTPSGVGDGQRPPVYLNAGQTVSVSIEGIGSTENRCVPDPAAPLTS